LCPHSNSTTPSPPTPPKEKAIEISAKKYNMYIKIILNDNTIDWHTCPGAPAPSDGPISFAIVVMVTMTPKQKPLHRKMISNILRNILYSDYSKK
jgi:hypothetical protein